MPINPIHFAADPNASTGVADLVGSLSGGFNAGFSPFEKVESLQGDKEKRRAMMLKNALDQEFGKREREADINYKNALTQNASDPFSRLTGIPAEIYGLRRLEDQLGSDDPIVQQVKKGFESRIRQQEALANSRTSLAESRNFNSMPSAEKQRTLAIIAGAGIDPYQGLKMLNAGASLDDVLATEGRTVEDVTPNYPLATSAITQLQQREGFANEIKTLENELNAAVPEGRTFAGYSIPETLKAISNKDPDSIGKTLAWRAMQPELAALRLKAMGGNVGIEAIREMKEAALGNLNVIGPSVSREAKQAMNRYISEWVEKAANTYNKSLTQGAKLGKKANQAEVAQTVAEIIKNSSGSAGSSDPLGLGL